ncbi:hypothetical protein LTS18_003387 [Coniosporium uncinatum]|uniref:Uncharacterized protein n=1 Tax=Coniosporium uncinatum TaxID=93489 RepID=A0ACC3DZM5_9PEZI|nr:hypothetical protein LTS18_003387 [Coniosporium uncinatum]
MPLRQLARHARRRLSLALAAVRDFVAPRPFPLPVSRRSPTAPPPSLASTPSSPWALQSSEPIVWPLVGHAVGIAAEDWLDREAQTWVEPSPLTPMSAVAEEEEEDMILL